MGGGADTVGFQCESGADDRIADFDLKLMQIESEHMEIPEQQYKVSVRLPSADFQKICRDLKEFGETMQIKATKEGITFSVQGDIGGGNVMLKPRESEKPEEKVALTVHEPVTATFALRYLVNFAKAALLCGAVELGLGPDAPLLVKYELEKAENGFMQFYLAPVPVRWQCRANWVGNTCLKLLARVSLPRRAWGFRVSERKAGRLGRLECVTSVMRHI